MSTQDEGHTSVNIPLVLRELLDGLARRRGLSRSGLIRLLVTDALREEAAAGLRQDAIPPPPRTARWRHTAAPGKGCG